MTTRRFPGEPEFGRGRQPQRFPSRSRLRPQFRGSFVLADFPAEAAEASAFNILDETFGNSRFSVSEAIGVLQFEGFEDNPAVVIQRMIEKGSLQRAA